MRSLSAKFNTRFSPAMLLGCAAVLLCGILFGRVNLLQGLRPLSGAWVLASGMALGMELPALLGVTLGALSAGLHYPEITALLPGIMLAPVSLIYRRAAKSISLPFGMLLTAAAQLSTLPFHSLLLYDLLRFLCEAGLAVGGYLCMRKCLQGVLRRFKLQDTGELLSAAMCIAMLLCGLTSLRIGTFGLDRVLLLWVCMFCAAIGGAGAGAGAGMTAGLISLLSAASDASFALMLGLGGLTGGALKPLGRAGVAFGFAAGALLMGLSAGLLRMETLPEIGVAGLLLLLLPQRLLSWLSGYILPTGEDRLREREAKTDALRRSVVARVEGFAECLEELSRIFIRSSAGEAGTLEDVAPLLEAVANEACTDCPHRERCWQDHFYDTYTTFITALSAPGSRKVLLETDFPQSFRDKCPHMERVLSSLRTVYGLYRIKSAYRKRIDESRQLVGKQLCGVAEVMEELGGELHFHIRYEDDAARIAREALQREGIPHGELLIQNRPTGMQVALKLKPCGGRRRCKAVEKLLSRALGVPLKADPLTCSQEECLLELREAVPMRIQCRSAQKGRENGLCGDACTHGSIDGRGYLLCLSDGMGTGARAAAEAQASVGLIEKFFRAGFPEEVIYTTVNQILLLRSAAESCCTLDLCLIDPVEARADFIKVGAAPSYIIRDGHASPVFAPALPMGMLEQINPCRIRRVLMDSDVIVMLSDGIAAAEDEEWLTDMLAAIAPQDPERAAKSIVELAAKRYGRRDDMTALVARVRRNKLKTAVSPLSPWKARVKGSEADKAVGT